MSEITLEQVYSGLSERLDTITNETISNGRKIEAVDVRLKAVEGNLNTIEFQNGGGRMILEPRKQFLQRLYDLSKEGGVLDQKMKACRESHDPTRRMERAGKKFDVYFRWGERIVIVVFALYVLVKLVDVEKVVKIIEHQETAKTQQVK